MLRNQVASRKVALKGSLALGEGTPGNVLIARFGDLADKPEGEVRVWFRCCLAEELWRSKISRYGAWRSCSELGIARIITNRIFFRLSYRLFQKFGVDSNFDNISI
jgi:hypothetical protein